MQNKIQLTTGLLGTLVLVACNPEPTDTTTISLDGARTAIATAIEPVPAELSAELTAELNTLYSEQTVVRLNADAAVADCLTTVNADVPATPNLVIFFNSDKGVNGLQKVANCFAADTGFAIAVQSPDQLPSRFEQGAGADIIIWAHDRFGSWAADGLLQAVAPSDNVKNSVPHDLFSSFAYNGSTYGYPLSVEGPVLLTNKALLANPVAALEDIDATLADTLAPAKPIVWDYNNSYFTRGLLFAQGGHEFAYVDGQGWDATDIDVNNAGAVASVTAIRGLITEGYMNSGVDYGAMDSAFKAGEVAMIINGPWAFTDYLQAGIDFSISKHPTIGGSSAKPFLGVLGVGIAAASSQKDVAKVFIEDYLLTEEAIMTIDADRSLGLTANVGTLIDIASNNPMLDEFAAAIGDSVPMPNIPQMGNFWSNMGPALTAILTNGEDAKTRLDAVQAAME